MLAIAETPDAIGTRDVSARPLLSAAAGAKSREEPGQERPRATWKREHGSDEPFGRTQDESERPARLARREAKSELAQVRAHHGFVHSGRTRARQRASSPSANTPKRTEFPREFKARRGILKRCRSGMAAAMASTIGVRPRWHRSRRAHRLPRPADRPSRPKYRRRRWLRLSS